MFRLFKRGRALPHAPALPFAPQDPKNYRPNIGLIACGGITEQHLRAYKAAGYQITKLYDPNRDKAEKRRAEFYPNAEVCDSYDAILSDDSIEVVDIAPHPKERVPIVEEALRAGKHVLSQKPFALDLDAAERLADVADECGRLLAVNQNGRWSPHWSYMRQAVDAGLIGEVNCADFMVHWDHNWTSETVFNEIHHLILYDFAIHWFDIATQFFGGPAKSVYAQLTHTKSQKAKPPMLANAVAEFEGGLATFVFHADTIHGPQDNTVVSGTKGKLVSTGADLGIQDVRLHTDAGEQKAQLHGTWFPDAFHGTMGELLCAIEEGRTPNHNARNNIDSLALCFAAVHSAETGAPVKVGSVRSL